MSMATETALDHAIGDCRRAVADVQRFALLGLAETVRDEHGDSIQFVLVEPCDQGPYLCSTSTGAGMDGEVTLNEETEDWVRDYVHNLWDPEEGTWTEFWQPFAIEHPDWRYRWWLDLDLILFCGGDSRRVAQLDERKAER